MFGHSLDKNIPGGKMGKKKWRDKKKESPNNMRRVRHICNSWRLSYFHHPYLYFLCHVCDIFDHLFSVFSSCNSLFSVPASLYRCRELSVQQRTISQPEHVRITASTRRTLVLFPPHQTSCVLPSGLMTTQRRRAVECGQIKQRRFALVKREVRKREVRGLSLEQTSTFNEISASHC